MSREVFELMKNMNREDIETQLALQCAPLLTGLKVSNLLILRNENAAYVKELFENTELSYCPLYRTDKKLVFLIYKASELERYLMEPDVFAFFDKLGYRETDLNQMLAMFRKRYGDYRKEGKEFPHEMGLFLGYPLEDVYGFMKNKGENYLYTGYWKVYDNVPAKISLFEKYEQAKNTLVELLACGISMKFIMESSGISQMSKRAV